MKKFLLMLTIVTLVTFATHPLNARNAKPAFIKTGLASITKHPVVAREKGTVKWFSSEKGYGFITRDLDGQDVFVHYSEIDMLGFRVLYEGERVSFKVEMGPKGLEAHNVRIVLLEL